MRLFIVLATLNLLLLVGALATSTPAASGRMPTSEASSLTLLGELDKEETLGLRQALDASALPVGVESVAADPGGVVVSAPKFSGPCFRVDGFLDQREASAARDDVRNLGGIVTFLGEVDAERRRFWVFVPPFRSRSDAQPVIARLKASGVRDYYMVPSGDHKNALSLGVFSSPEAAQRRVKEVAALKRKVEVQEVVFPGKRLVMDVTWPPGLEPSWQGLAKNLTPRSIECPRI